MLISIGLNAGANGNPVMRFSSIERVANPEPLSISEITIENEKVAITHENGYNCFEITYRLKNNSGRNFPEIQYGFPIDYLVADEAETLIMIDHGYTEGMFEVGWNEALIKDISFRLDSMELQFRSAKESVRQVGQAVSFSEDNEIGEFVPVIGVDRRWFYTQFTMSPHSESDLTVRYKVYANSKVWRGTDATDFSQYIRKPIDSEPISGTEPLAYRYFANTFSILYDFTPARHFGNGKSYELSVDIDLSNLDNPRILQNNNLVETSSITYTKFGPASEFEPINISIFHNIDHSPQAVAAILRPFIIPVNNYNVQYGADYLEIEFREPTFVSELVADIDPDVVESIHSSVFYADGHVSENAYSQMYNYDPSERNTIKSPIILSVTDFCNDGWGYYYNPERYEDPAEKMNNPHFRINKIRLDFQRKQNIAADIVVCTNILPLDSRFGNDVPD